MDEETTLETIACVTNNITMMTSSKSVVEIIELLYLSHVALLTIFGNFLVVLAFIRGPRRMRTYTNYFVVNLAMTDLLVGCVSLPFWIVFRSRESLISDTLYNTIFPLDVLSGVTSILCLAAISVERLVAVRFPNRHVNLTRRVVMSAIFATWFVGVVVSAPQYIGMQDVYMISVYTAAIFIIGFVIPLCVIIASYCFIFHKALNMMKADNAHASNDREIRVAKTVSLVICLFVICWCPFFIVNMVFVFCRTCAHPKWAIYVSKLLHYSNSAMNFVVYAIRIPDFRHSFQSFMCRRQAKEKRRSVVSTTAIVTAPTAPTASTTTTQSICVTDMGESLSSRQRSQNYLSVEFHKLVQHHADQSDEFLMCDTTTQMSSLSSEASSL